MTTLVTGATGFVGAALVRALRTRGRSVRVALRRPGDVEGVQSVLVGDLSPATNWSPSVDGVRVVVHLAARVHQMRDDDPDRLAEYRRVNTDSTVRLAEQAAAAGVRRFVFVSSVKVHGDEGRFREADPLSPAGAYAVSKADAERALGIVAMQTGMALTIIRPPLVYGPGVRANFRLLARAIQSGIPLPFASIHNRRSLVGIDNLVDFIVTCTDHPAAENEAFLVSDGEDLSTPALIRRMAAAMGRSPRLYPVPAGVLDALAVLLRQRDAIRRLSGTLTVNIDKAMTRLDWKAPVTVDEALHRALRALA